MKARRSSGVAILTAVGLLQLAGCHATRPDVPGDAALATGVTDAIVFRADGEPLDNDALPSNSLTLDQVVRLTLSHDARIQSALAKVRVAEAEANQARLLPNPVLSIDVRYPRGGDAGHVFEASLSEDLLQILEKPTQIRAADDRLRAASADALTIVLDVMAEAQSAFVSARELEAEISAAEVREQGLRHVREIAQVRQNAGDASRLEVLILDSQLAQASLDSADLLLRQTELRLILAKLIGQPRFAGVFTLARTEPRAELIGAERDWLEVGLRHRPELQSKVWELRALGEDVSLATWSSLQGTSVGVHAERDPEWRLGPTLALPLPIFDWGQETTKKAKAQRIAARHDLVEQQRRLVQEIRFAYATYVQASASLASAWSTLIPLQQAQLDQARVSYKIGEADLATTLIAEGDYRTGLSRVAKLEEAVALARIKLERATGGAGFAAEVTGGPASATSPSTSPTTKGILP